MTRISWFIASFASLLCAAQLAAQVPAVLRASEQAASPSDAEKESSEKESDQSTKREDVAEKLRVAKRALDSAKEISQQNQTEEPEHLQREVELLKQLEVSVAQRELAKSKHADLLLRLKDLEAQLTAVRDVGPKPTGSRRSSGPGNCSRLASKLRGA